MKIATVADMSLKTVPLLLLQTCFLSCFCFLSFAHSENQEICLFKVVLFINVCRPMYVREHLFSEGLLCLFFIHVCVTVPTFVYRAVFGAENEAQGTQTLVQMFD